MEEQISSMKLRKPLCPIYKKCYMNLINNDNCYNLEYKTCSWYEWEQALPKIIEKIESENSLKKFGFGIGINFGGIRK